MVTQSPDCSQTVATQVELILMVEIVIALTHVVSIAHNVSVVYHNAECSLEVVSWVVGLLPLRAEGWGMIPAYGRPPSATLKCI